MMCEAKLVRDTYRKKMRFAHEHSSLFVFSNLSWHNVYRRSTAAERNNEQPLNLRVLICSEQKNVYASAVYIKGTKDYYLHCTIRRYWVSLPSNIRLSQESYVCLHLLLLGGYNSLICTRIECTLQPKRRRGNRWAVCSSKHRDVRSKKLDMCLEAGFLVDEIWLAAKLHFHTHSYVAIFLW